MTYGSDLRVLHACLVALAATGCYRTEATPSDEAAAVAEALTRSVSFVGGSLEEGSLPASDDDSVSLVPLEDTIVLNPGDTSLMSLSPDNPDGSDDPIEAVLVQFGKANQHVEVTNSASEDSSTLVQHFDVDDDVCSTLCNKRFSVEVRQQLKLRSGKVGRAVVRTIQLECSERGSAKFCSNRGSSHGGDLEGRVLANLERCDLLAHSGDLSVDHIPCLWECLADMDCASLRGGFCGGTDDLVGCAQSCSASETNNFNCNNGDTTSIVFVCDGDDDCSDGSDELGCETLFCDGEEMPSWYRCDLVQDCSDGSDEVGCAALSCSGSVAPGGEGGFGGFGGGEAGIGGGTAGFGGMAGGFGQDGGPVAGASGAGGGGGASAGVGGAAGGGGAPRTDAGPAPAGYGDPCAVDSDCSAGAPHCVYMGPLDYRCSIQCDGATTCPMVQGFPGTPPCGADGFCGSFAQ